MTRVLIEKGPCFGWIDQLTFKNRGLTCLRCSSHSRRLRKRHRFSRIRMNLLLITQVYIPLLYQQKLLILFCVFCFEYFRHIET